MKRYHLRKYDTIRDDHHQHAILIWGDIPYWLAVNRDLELLVSVMDNHTVDEIFDIAIKEINPLITMEEIISVLDSMEEAGLFTDESSEARQEVSDLYSLQYITLNITNNCNLYCKHCYIDAMTGHQDYMLLDSVSAIIGQLRQIAIPSCNIIVSGGEALKHPECLDILSLISRMTTWTITLVTNGTLIDDFVAGRLSCIDRLSIQISLDGATEKTHDYIRGKGSFRKTVDGIRTLAKHDIAFYLSPIVTEQLYAELEQYFCLSKQLGAKAVFMQPINQVGRAKKNRLKRVDDSLVFRKVLDLYKKDTDLIRAISRTLESKYVNNIRYLDSCNYCGTGSATMAIQPNGDVFPCPNFIIPEMRIGNILEDNILDMWISSPVLQKLRRLDVNTNLPEKCRSCSVKLFCGGGCRGLTYQNTGDLYALSENCEYEKKQKMNMLWALSEKPDLFLEDDDRHEAEFVKKAEEAYQKAMEIREAFQGRGSA